MASRRSLLLAGVGLAVLLTLSVGALASPSGDDAADDSPAQVAQAEQAQLSAHGGAGENGASTLQGEVTTAPQYYGDKLVLGTERGVYVFGPDGSLQHHVDTQPVQRFAVTEDGTLVATVENEYFDNVVGIDLESGEQVWRTGETVAVYNPDFGEVDRQAHAFDVAAVGNGNVAVSIGKQVLVLDAASGDKQWSYEHDFTVWDVESDGSTVYAGTQDGRVLALGASNGARKFSKKLVEPYETNNQGDVPRAVWAVKHVTIGGADRIATTGEDGFVRLLDPNGGTVLWSEQVREYDENIAENYYSSFARQNRGAIPGDGTFFNLRLTVVDDGDRTGFAVADLTEKNAERRSFRDASKRLHLLDANSGSTQWTNDEVEMGAAGSLAYHGESNTLLVPNRPVQSSISVTQIDPADGSTSGSLSYPSVPMSSRGVRRSATSYVSASGDELALVSTKSDLLISDASGTLQWSYPGLRNVDVTRTDLTGDDSDEYVIASGDRMDQSHGPYQPRGIVVRNPADGSIEWAKTVDVGEYATAGGIRPIGAFEADGDRFLVTLRKNSEEVEETDRVVIYNGNDGSKAAQVPGEGADVTLNLRSVTLVSDALQSGSEGILMAGRDRVVVVDSQTGNAWMRSYQDRRDLETYRPVEGNDITYVTVGDHNDDGRDAVLAYSRDGALAVIQPTGTGPEMAFETISESQVEGQPRRDSARAIGDITGDGYQEVALEIRGEEETQLAIYSPGQGQVIESFDQARVWQLNPVTVQVGGEPTEGFVASSRSNEDTRVEAHFGDGNTLEYEFDERNHYRNIRNNLAAAPAGDVNGDGTEDVAVVESTAAGDAVVKLLDPTTDEELDEVVLERTEEDGRTKPGLYTQRIADQTGDGNPEVGVVTNVGGRNRLDVRWYVVDPQAGEVLVSGQGFKRGFLGMENSLGLLDRDGSLTTVDVSQGVTLDEPSNGQTVELSWSFDLDENYVSRIYVDGRPVALTTDTEASVRLPPGEHTVQVRATSEDGRTVYDSREVEVTEGSSLDLALYGATVLAIAVLFVPYGLRRVRW